MNVKLSLQLIRNMGVRYTMYRIKHEIQKKTGYLTSNHPINPSKKEFISLEDLRSQKNDFFWDSFSELNLSKNPISNLKESVEKIKNGDVLFFSNEWKSLGVDYDWITNPDTGYKYDVSKHWSQIQDLNPENGDIKYVWEKSRFSWLLTVVRHDYHFDEDNSEFIFNQIERWIDANPINQGPNYRCSQEISLRVMNWAFALNYYKQSKAITNERWGKIQNAMYWQLLHVYKHIDFSRIAVRNNHAITETMMLALSEILFPFIPESKQWAKAGRTWFEEEIDYQVYNDGTFLQFSMNYHRVVIQLLTFGISISEKCQKPFSKTVKEKAYKSVNFLFQCLQEKNGYLPNYGSNDGALFFPLSNAEYRDYRPQLNALHFLLTGKDLYFDLTNCEDKFWFGNSSLANTFEPIKKVIGTSSFPNGGFYLARTSQSFVMLRCGNHKDRPAHADNLHLDYWLNGENLLQDAGSYKYNTTKEFQNYFTGTSSHNTVKVQDFDQMLKGSRFIWYYWSQCKEAKWEETKDAYLFKGAIIAFKHLNENIEHHRTLKLFKDDSGVEVIDEVINARLNCSQIWHSNKLESLEIESISENENLKPESVASYYSSMYGLNSKSKGIKFIFGNKITTRIKPKD